MLRLIACHLRARGAVRPFSAGLLDAALVVPLRCAATASVPARRAALKTKKSSGVSRSGPLEARSSAAKKKSAISQGKKAKAPGTPQPNDDSRLVADLQLLRGKRQWDAYCSKASSAATRLTESVASTKASNKDELGETLLLTAQVLQELLRAIEISQISRSTNESKMIIRNISTVIATFFASSTIASACRSQLHLSRSDPLSMMTIFLLSAIAEKQQQQPVGSSKHKFPAPNEIFETIHSSICQLPKQIHAPKSPASFKVESVRSVLKFARSLLQNDREFSIQQRDMLIAAVATSFQLMIEQCPSPEKLLMEIFLTVDNASSVLPLVEELGETPGGEKLYTEMVNALLRVFCGIAVPLENQPKLTILLKTLKSWLDSLPESTKRSVKLSLFTSKLPSAMLVALAIAGIRLPVLLSSPLGGDLDVDQLLALAGIVPTVRLVADGKAPTLQPLPKALTDRILSAVLPKLNSPVPESQQPWSANQQLPTPPQPPSESKRVEAAAPLLLVELISRGQVDEATVVVQRLVARKFCVGSMSATLGLISDLCTRLAHRIRGHHGQMDEKVRRAASEVVAILTARAADLIQVSLQRKRTATGSKGRSSAPSLVEDDDYGNLVFACCSLISQSAALGVKATATKTHYLVALLTDTLQAFAISTRADTPQGEEQACADMTAAVVTHCRDMVAKASELRTSLHLRPDGTGYAHQLLHDAVGCMLNEIEAAAARAATHSSHKNDGSAAVVRLKEQQVNELGQCYTTLYQIFGIEVERAVLQAFRSRVLEPAIVALMQHRQMSPATAATFASVACHTFTAHSASDDFLLELVKVCSKWNGAKHPPGALAEPAADVLVSAAIVATSPSKRESFAHLMTCLCPFVKPVGAIRILASAASSYDRASTTSILPPQIDDLALAIASIAHKATAVPLGDVVQSLRHLYRLGKFERSYCMPLIERICSQRTELSLGQCGIVAGLLPRFLPDGEEKKYEDLLSSLKATVLAGRNTCPPSDVPLVVRGFAMLPGSSDKYRAMRAEVLAAYILRVMTVAPMLDAHQVVRCVQSFSAGEVVHSSLFGLLLSRAADLKGTFSIPLAVELVHCAVSTSYDEGTQRACVTAAQSVFLFVVSHLLQNDLGTILVRGRNAELLLGCLEAVAPKERIADDVLRVVSQHAGSIPVQGIMAALALIAARRGTDVAAYQAITRHCIEKLIAGADKHQLAQLALLLVRCGCRGAELFNSVERRCEVLLKEFDSACVAAICDAYQEARYDNTELIVAIVVNLVPALAPKMTAAQVLSVMSVMFTSRTQHPQASYVLFGRLVEVAKELDSQQVARILKIASSLRINRNRKFSAAMAMRVEDLEGEFTADPTSALHTAHNLVRIKAHEFPIVTRLLDVVFLHRAVLLKRQLLMELARNIFQCDGVTPNLHPMLHAFAVKGDIIMADGKSVSLESLVAPGEAATPTAAAEAGASPDSKTLGKLFSISPSTSPPKPDEPATGGSEGKRRSDDSSRAAPVEEEERPRGKLFSIASPSSSSTEPARVDPGPGPVSPVSGWVTHHGERDDEEIKPVVRTATRSVSRRSSRRLEDEAPPSQEKEEGDSSKPTGTDVESQDLSASTATKPPQPEAAAEKESTPPAQDVVVPRKVARRRRVDDAE